jgi:uncharacterized protein YjbJ (UPF0337 family)
MFQQARAGRAEASRPDNPFEAWDISMDKDRIEGAKKQVVGSVKEALGKVTGNDRVEAEGTAEKTAGKIQGKAGEAKDAVRDAVKR